MKKISRLIIPLTLIICFVSCKKGFEKKNQDPYALTKIDPGLLFTGAELGMNAGNWDGEQTIAQQYMNGYNSGATAGFNFNQDVDGYNSPRWGIYTSTIKSLVAIIDKTQNDPAAKNLYNMTRIWKAYAFMTLVDTYGDVPYSEAGLGYLKGINYPKYDKMATIYADLYNELKTATAALSASNEYVSGDLFFGGPGSSAAAQVGHWKKIGYSLLLRLGMRYSKIDQVKAASIAQEAYAGGVMQSNADNVVIKGYSTANPNNFSALQRNVSPYFYYLAQPFVSQLKNTKDPRLKYVGASYAQPQSFTSTRDTTTANQFGYPVGYDQQSVVNAPGYRGTKGGGQNYTQLNYDVVANVLTPQFFITYSQTQLLLAEASFRGWVTGSLSTQLYYETGIKASMDEYLLYPNVQNPAISVAEENSFVNQPLVLYNSANALQLINTQYWISSFVNGPESWANLRRSGFPVLQTNKYTILSGDGFIHRMAYPNAEDSQNSANYRAAVTSMGGDDLTQHIFWDVP